MAALFDAASLGALATANRFVFSATWLGLADAEGHALPSYADYLAGVAKSGIGLIITGHCNVTPDGKAGPGQTAAWDDRFLPGLHAVAAAVHEADGKVVLQISHAGCYAAAALTGLDVVAPSAASAPGIPPCRELTVEEIGRIVAAFGEAAARGKKAGFDGVQIHAAHGYLLSEFLSPYYNRRTDSYGGSLENRMRIVVETLRSVRSAVGPAFPVLIKINAEDFIEGGLTVEEMLEFAAVLEREGIDAIEMSGGTIASGALMPIRPGLLEREKEGFYRETAARLKKQVAVPVMLVGGIRSLEVCEELVAHGATDYVSLCRPLICEPDLLRRWKSGNTVKSACISCNGCLKTGFKEGTVRCLLPR